MPIKFAKVSYVYAPKSPYECVALRDVDLDIREHSFTFIVGKTGSGKSTLIQELNGLLIPTSGAVYIDDFVVSRDRKAMSPECEKRLAKENEGHAAEINEILARYELAENDFDKSSKNAEERAKLRAARREKKKALAAAEATHKNKIKEIKKASTKRLTALRKKVGIVFQFAENQLFEETLEKDVAFGPMNFGLKGAQALEVARKYLKEVGFDESYFKKSPLEISGGEKRLAAIAGILALEPDVLVLDEPTAGLDPYGAEKMMAIFSRLHEEGKTIVVVTHDMNLVLRYAEDVIVLDDGRVVRHAAPSELFLEDLEKYSLETPLISRLIGELNRRGLRLDLAGIRDIPTLVGAIRKARAKA